MSLLVIGRSGVERSNHFIDVPAATPVVQITLSIDGNVDEFVYEVSLDSGSSWTTLGTGVTYGWAIDADDYAALFANGNSVNARFQGTKVLNNGVVYTTDVTIYKTTIVSSSIKPTTLDTIDLAVSDPYDVDNHTKPFWYLDGINFLWAYDNDTPTTVWNVYLEELNSSGQVAGTPILLYGELSRAVLNLAYNFGHYRAGQSPVTNEYAMSAGQSKRLWRLKFVGNADYDNDVTYGSVFAVTALESELDSPTVWYRPRIDTHKRIAAEKGLFLDEVPILAQFEAGANIIISQRDTNGRRAKVDGTANAADPQNFAKAGNIVIEAVVPTVKRRARAVMGTFTPTSPDNNWVAGDIYYGTAYYWDLVHNWKLGISSNNTLHVAGQTPASFHLEITQITGIDPLNFASPTNQVAPFWQIQDENTIRIYAILKDSNNYPSLLKDRVFTEAISLYYYYKLVEVIPETGL